jgi:hypothetical protein
MTIQWHPIFAKVLRPLVHEHYDVETNVPVGDAPREADVVLLRRTGRRRPPFRGLWRHLTTWNVVEFKGRSVSARVRDLPLLVELGLGIARRLNEKRESAGEPLVPLEAVMPGVWRCQLLRHLVFLVSSVAVPVEHDTTPIHLLARESPETATELARVLVEEPGLWELYGPLLHLWHPNVWKEATRMARSKGKSDPLGLRPFIETVGVGEVVKAMGVKRLVEEVGVEALLKEIDLDALLAHLTPAQLRQLQQRVAKRG